MGLIAVQTGRHKCHRTHVSLKAFKLLGNFSMKLTLVRPDDPTFMVTYFCVVFFFDKSVELYIKKAQI
jgi:hypothetical protein